MERPIVLLVDDDPSMRLQLGQLFQTDGGYRIGGIAEDGLEGAMLAAELSPDVVILDHFMPRWDGSKAAAFIRARCPSAKIVAFSAAGTETPQWADASAFKSEIENLIELVHDLVA